jgi:hypothetical protein
MRRGITERPSRYASFRDKILEIEDSVLTESIGHIRRAGVTDWKAAAWFLTHRFRKEWGDELKRDTSKAANRGARTYQDTDNMSLDELNAEIARLEARLSMTVAQGPLSRP